MIVWIASYPKSGNTLVRSMLAAYFFSENGVFNFDLLRNISQFPNNNLFEKLGIDPMDENETIKNYIKAQKELIIKNSIQLLKTHSSLFNIRNNLFTDLKNSLGAIYIVRDPRNVATSFANHLDIPISSSIDIMIEKHYLGGIEGATTEADRTLVYTGNWGFNFKSWKSFEEQNKYLLIRYEDLIEKRELSFLKILEFLHKLQNKKLKVNHEKLKNVILSTSFENMKKLEERNGFTEAKKQKITGQPIKFFNQASKNNWKKNLDEKLRNKIENAFRKEMLELGYL